MERDDGIKLQQLPCSDNFTSLAAASSSRPPPQIRPSSSSASHTCGYCKREFRSAQGLGGHMNVHRMDRARLIHHQCSPHHRLAPPPNPNPSHRRTVLDLLGSGCCGCCPAAHAAAAGDGGSAAPAAAAMANCRLSSASSSATTKDDFEVKNLERRMGACSHGDDGAEARLDLELRLGYS